MNNCPDTTQPLKQGENFPPTLDESSSWDIFADDEQWNDEIAEFNPAASAAAAVSKDVLDLDLTNFVYNDSGQSEVDTQIDDNERSSILNGLGLQSPAPAADSIKHKSPTSRTGGSHGELATDRDAQACLRARSNSTIAASGSDTDNDVDVQTNVSSTASVSEYYSDDGSVSRSNTPCSFLPAGRGAAIQENVAPPSTPSSCGSVTGVKRSAKSASLCPRPFVGPSPTFGDLARLSTQAAQGSVNTVTSGPGLPLLPFTFVPAYQPSTAGGPYGTTGNNTAAAMSTLPGLRDLQPTAVLTAASEAASQVIAAGWKRLKGEDSAAKIEEKPGVEEGRRRVLFSKTHVNAKAGGGTPEGENACGTAQRKRSKKEERLMKNREAANRSRMKRKEVLSDLNNRVAALTRSLEESRQENNVLRADKASLREENSFLRGMLSGTGQANELPANSTPRRASVSRSGGVATPGGGTRSGGAPGVGAIAGVVGTALAVVSCIAISAAGSTDEGSAGGAALSSVHGVRMGGGRALLWMPVEDIAGHAEPQHVLRLSEVVGSAMPWSGLAVILLSLAVYLLADVAWRGRRSSRHSTS